MKKILGLMLLFLTFNSFAAYDIVNVNETKRDGKDVVQEVFYYACSHCAKMESKINEWEKTLDSNVISEKVPVVLSPIQRLAAKHYYTSLYLGVEDKFTPLYFDSLVKKGKKISDQTAKSILLQIGEKSDKIDSAFLSHWVEDRVEKAKETTLRLKVSSVPLFFVNDKYVLKRTDYKNDEELFLELSELVK